MACTRSILLLLCLALAEAFTSTPFFPKHQLQKQIKKPSSSSPPPLNAVCLVTGSSRGLGRAIALDLAKADSANKLVLNYAGSEAAALAVVSECEALGVEAFAVQADCSKTEDIDRMFKEIVEKFGTCDVLVNNAGITKDGLVMRMKPEAWQSVIDVNLSGVFYTSQAFFKIASKKRVGRIINISSVVGQVSEAINFARFNSIY